MNTRDKIIQIMQLILTIIILILTIYGTVYSIKNHNNSIIEYYDDSAIKKVELIKEKESKVDRISVKEEEHAGFPIDYEVKQCETLWGISEKVYNNGLMYIYIMDINNLDSDEIYIGQHLILEYLDDNDKEEFLLKSYDKLKEIDSLKEVVYNVFEYNKDNMTYIGNYTITGYDPYCTHCCSGTGITASGKIATINYTIAASRFPFGTKLYIEGYGIYEVQDRGVGNGVIDIAVNSHSEAYKTTGYNIPVYYIN